MPPLPVERPRRLGCCRRRRSSTFKNAARLGLPCTTSLSCNLHGFQEIFSRQLTQNIQILTKHQQKSAIVRRRRRCRSSIERPRRLGCCCRRRARRSTFNAVRLWLPCTTFSSCNLHGRALLGLAQPLPRAAPPTPVGLENIS